MYVHMHMHTYAAICVYTYIHLFLLVLRQATGVCQDWNHAYMGKPGCTAAEAAELLGLFSASAPKSPNMERVSHSPQATS